MFVDNAAEAGTDLSLALTRLKREQQNRLKLIGHDGQTSLRDCTVWLWTTTHVFHIDQVVSEGTTMGINGNQRLMQTVIFLNSDLHELACLVFKSKFIGRFFSCFQLNSGQSESSFVILCHQIFGRNNEETLLGEFDHIGPHHTHINGVMLGPRWMDLMDLAFHRHDSSQSCLCWLLRH